MKKNWKKVLFIIATFLTGFTVCLLWTYEESLILKISETIFLIGLLTYNTIIMYKK